ncbi:MAG TPA: hypothetical protein VN903_17755 [Polyangia bacterium]|nr:hypothetical protein [Polyangia bacterium]
MITLAEYLWFAQAGGNGPLPPPPSRAAVCTVRPYFAGLTVVTQQYGTLPWYDPALFALTSRDDRQAVYNAKRSVGATHCIMTFDPDEGGYVNRLGPYKDIIIPYSHMGHPERMREDTREVLTQGFTPIVNLGCDKDDGPYYQNALDRLHALVDCLKADPADLTQYVLVTPGWDGTFYGWTIEQITDFGQEFRRLLPNGYLAIEHDPGHIPMGGGPADWAIDGPMATWDVILSEYDYSDDTPPSGSVWQVACRLLGPKWVRPSDCDDYITTEYAIAHWYLGQGNPRGPYFPCAFEWWATYNWVQWRTTAESVASQRAYLSALGYGVATG